MTRAEHDLDQAFIHFKLPVPSSDTKVIEEGMRQHAIMFGEWIMTHAWDIDAMPIKDCYETFNNEKP